MKALVVMTRIPVPSKTKTRLQTILSPYECAEIHKSFLKDILETVCKLEEKTDIYLFYGDEGPLNIIEDILPERVATLPQRGETLGEKMKNIFSDLFERGYERVVLMGADIPEVDVKDIEEAIERRVDLVFGPTLDGGYYLVGMSKLHEIIFSPEIRWGTPQVFQKTIDILKEGGIEVGFIKTREDIDTEEDLKEFWKRIKNTQLCENTKRYLLKDIRERLL